MGLFRKRQRFIDLRDRPSERAATPAPSTQANATRLPNTKLEWGKPSRCPSCGSPGYLDKIDLVRRVMYQHCPSCMNRWETSEAEILEAHARRSQ